MTDYPAVVAASSFPAERRETATAFATAKAEAEAREIAVRTQVQQLADAAMAKQLAALPNGKIREPRFTSS